MRENIDYEKVVTRLVERVPDLQPVLESHMRDFDEVLPHVFFGEVARFVIEAFRAMCDGEGEDSPRSPAMKVLAFLEEAAASADERVRELISVSFVENLVGVDDISERARRLLGPRLRAELESYEDR